MKKGKVRMAVGRRTGDDSVGEGVGTGTSADCWRKVKCADTLKHTFHKVKYTVTT